MQSSVRSCHIRCPSPKGSLALSLAVLAIIGCTGQPTAMEPPLSASPGSEGTSTPTTAIPEVSDVPSSSPEGQSTTDPGAENSQQNPPLVGADPEGAGPAPGLLASEAQEVTPEDLYGAGVTSWEAPDPLGQSPSGLLLPPDVLPTTGPATSPDDWDVEAALRQQTGTTLGATLWKEDFNGNGVGYAGLSPDDWVFENGDGSDYGIPGWGNGEQEYYLTQNAATSGGLLTITIKKETYTKGSGTWQYTSSRLKTRGLRKFMPSMGPAGIRVEARIKLPAGGRGVWPAFWMLPDQQWYGGWPVSGEIDIMEVRNTELLTYGTVHFGNPWIYKTQSTGLSDRNFHTFALDWTPTSLTWLLDGAPFYYYPCNKNPPNNQFPWFTSNLNTYPPMTSCAPYDVPFYILLNCAVGGGFPGQPDGTAQFPQQMIVDYVAVYQLATVAPAPPAVITNPCAPPTCRCYSTYYPVACYYPTQFRCVNGNTLVPGSEPGNKCPSVVNAPPAPPAPRPPPSPPPYPPTVGRKFNIINKCSYTIWPAYYSDIPGFPEDRGFRLNAGQSRVITLPVPSPGLRIWARTGCTFDSTGKGKCDTGDCGGVLQCRGAGSVPATLAEFAIFAPGYAPDGFTYDLDGYDISNVDGFNLPLSITPKGNFKPDPSRPYWCLAPACRTNINAICPPELQLKNAQGAVVACKSACVAFNQPQYCCIGAYGKPETCPPTSYSMLFKNACPDAYSYPYDDNTSFYSCDSAYQLNYDITFCP
eukprot:jgi/Botrbrau1/17456/Bobra.0054s0045.1